MGHAQFFLLQFPSWFAVWDWHSPLLVYLLYWHSSPPIQHMGKKLLILHSSTIHPCLPLHPPPLFKFIHISSSSFGSALAQGTEHMVAWTGQAATVATVAAPALTLAPALTQSGGQGWGCYCCCHYCLTGWGPEPPRILCPGPKLTESKRQGKGQEAGRRSKWCGGCRDHGMGQMAGRDRQQGARCR